MTRDHGERLEAKDVAVAVDEHGRGALVIRAENVDTSLSRTFTWRLGRFARPERRHLLYVDNEGVTAGTAKLGAVVDAAGRPRVFWEGRRGLLTRGL